MHYRSVVIDRKTNWHQEEHRGVIMYNDPNTGGQIFQLLAVIFAALSGIVLVFSSKIRMFWSRLKRRFRESGDENLTEIENVDAGQNPDD